MFKGFVEMLKARLQADEMKVVEEFHQELLALEARVRALEPQPAPTPAPAQTEVPHAQV